MYDKYSPFQSVEIKDFDFFPQDYKIWQDGKVIQFGKTYSAIKFINIDEGKFEVICNDKHLKEELNESIIFDILVTQHDRLNFLTIPKGSNSQNIELVAMVLGHTREAKKFAYNEPYSCSMFTLNNNVEKISFSFIEPNRTVEFYVLKEDDVSIDGSNILVRTILKMLSDGQDNCATILITSQVIDTMLEKYNITSSDEDVKQAIAYINSISRVDADIVERTVLMSRGHGQNIYVIEAVYQELIRTISNAFEAQA